MLSKESDLTSPPFITGASEVAIPKYKIQNLGLLFSQLRKAFGKTTF